ncbi:MAG TPA: hypothetical protein VHB79_19760 [Polyangiaceae bacterium]|nr:hypothetical protein [Polyangiaceae bacterium]
MRSARLAGLVALLGFARPALAQAPAGGDAACGKVMNEAAPSCAAINKLENELQTLEVKQHALERDARDPNKPQAAAELARVTQDIDKLKGQIEQLKTSPLLRLDGFCSSVGPEVPRTCDVLASLLGAFDDGALQPTEQTKQALATAAGAAAADAAAADRQTANNKSGSSAQLDPVESIQPITLAGGAFTLAGTRSGSKGVGTVSVNPLALALPTNVKAARLVDLSVSAPFDLSGSSGNDDPYISTRLRLNIAGPFMASELQTAFDAWLKASGAYADKLQNVLLHAKDVKRCVEYIAQNHRAEASACEQNVASSDVRALREKAYSAMAKVRREADSFYLGIDGRFDTGDPTGPTVKGDFGNHVLGGIAGGGRIPVGTLWDVELRGRVAGDVFKSREPVPGGNEPVGSFDWGAAVILSGRLKESAKQRLAFGVGAEGRHAFSDSEAAKNSPTNYVLLNLMTVVPALSGGDIGLALGVPLYDLQDVRGVTVNFSTDLGLLDHSL